ncbi:MAG: toxic anion resistance protein [Clostridia bacterium]|nr:toxic anion resistance protein [Clostridia bacterium]
MSKLPDITEYTKPLTQELLSSAQNMAEQMDLSSLDGILSIGNNALSNVGDVSSELVSVALETDLDSALDEITKVAKHVTKFSRMLRHGKALSKPNSKERIGDAYDILKIELARVSANLDTNRRSLIRSISLLEDINEQNLHIFQTISVTLEACKYHISQCDLQEMDPNLMHRLEMKLSDLETSQLVCQQTATQIFLLRDSAIALLDRINSINDNIFPLWTTQVALALGISTMTEGKASTASAYSAISEATRSLTDEITTTGKCIADTHKAIVILKA